jgi:hypothetical protein
MFGGMNNLSKEEYQQFYNQTGIDVDNRMMLVSNFANTMERNITKFVAFTKMIPGFATLPVEDQANLVKCRCITLRKTEYIGVLITHSLEKNNMICDYYFVVK